MSLPDHYFQLLIHNASYSLIYTAGSILYIEGIGEFFRAHLPKKKGFCLLAPFLIKFFFQNSGHYIGCHNRTQIKSRIDPVQTKEKWQTIFCQRS